MMDTFMNLEIKSNLVTTSLLNNLVDRIESMNKINQIKVLLILKQNTNLVINENQYGLHINISDLDKKMVEELLEFARYVKTQESVLSVIEQEKETLQSIYFSKGNKDSIENITIHS